MYRFINDRPISNHVKEEEYRNSRIIFVNIYLAHPLIVTWRLHSGRTLQHRKPNMFDFTFSILSLLPLFSSDRCCRNISFNRETLRP